MTDKFSGLVWITGLPGAGKSTFTNYLVKRLHKDGIRPVVLDGDALRRVFNNQQYDIESRRQLAMQYSRLCQLLVSQKVLVLCATVSMFADVRKFNRECISNYIEVFLDVSQELLIERNQKNLYVQACEGENNQLPGQNQAAELPVNADFHCIDMLDSDISRYVDKVSDKIFSTFEQE